jgi:hypothetical protein
MTIEAAFLADLYENWAAEALSAAKSQRPHEGDWRDAYEELASELVSLANLALAAA